MTQTKIFKLLSTGMVVLQLLSAGLGSAATVSFTTENTIQKTTKSRQNTVEYTAELKTNANSVNTGSVLDLSLIIRNNNDENIAVAGTVFTITVSSKVIDYSTIDFSDPVLTKFFDYVVDSNTGQIKLTVKQDVVGEGTEIIPVIHATVTGTAGNSYKIGASSSDGIAMGVINDTINITDGGATVYGDINSYWGIHEGLNGNFIGKASTPDNTGVFSRSKNQIDIFGEFNTTYEHWEHFINNTDRWVSLKFDYDPRENLDESSIKLYKKSDYSTVPFTTTHEPTPGEHLAGVHIDTVNHNFIVTLKDNWIVGGASSQEVLVVGYSATVKDATLTYDNSMTLEKEDQSTVQTFGLHSIFSENGASDVFPTIVSKDLRYPLGKLTPENAENILKQDASPSAIDTIDGEIASSKISVDTSKVDFSKPGIYEVKYKVTNSSNNTAGKTYMLEIYASNAKDITVHYVDTDGNKISGDVVKTGNVGEAYTTEQKDIAGYTFKEVQGDASGTFTDQAQTVTYVYTEHPVVGGDITVHYVDTDGNKISGDVVKTGNVGEAYTTEQKDIAGYTFKEVQGDASGTFTDQAQTVTYVYTKHPVVGGDITVHYVDTDGNKISGDVVKTGNVGEAYTTEQKDIAGYTFKEVQGDASGTFTDQAQTVTYVYTKHPVVGGDITVHYVDTDGNKISGDVVKTGNVGEAYTTEQKDIAGYTFKEVQGDASGTFTDQAQTVTYVYTKNNVNPTPKPNIPQSGNDNGNKIILPQTGENDELSIIGLFSNLLLFLVTTVLIILKRKRQN